MSVTAMLNIITWSIWSPAVAAGESNSAAPARAPWIANIRRFIVQTLLVWRLHEKTLPACQLRDLNEVAAVVVQLRNGRAGHVGGRHRELGAAGLDPLVVALDVVGEKHDRGLALLKHRLLIGFGCGVVVQRQLQLDAVRVLGRGYGQPAI